MEAPAVGILQSATFVRYQQEDQACHTDLTESEWGQRLALHLAKSFFDPDFEKCECSGFLSPRGKGFGIYILEPDGQDSPLSVEFEDKLPGNLLIRPRQGYTVADVIGRDLLTPIKGAWLAARGLDIDMPCDISASVDDGALRVEVRPVL